MNHGDGKYLTMMLTYGISTNESLVLVNGMAVGVVSIVTTAWYCNVWDASMIYAENII